MSYFLRSETLSTCAGLSFPLRDVREFSSNSPSISINNRTKEIYGVKYNYKTMTISKLSLNPKLEENWYNYVRSVLVPTYNVGDDLSNSTAFRAKIGNLYLIFNLYNDSDVCTSSLGFSKLNKKEGRTPADYRLTISTGG